MTIKSMESTQDLTECLQKMSESFRLIREMSDSTKTITSETDGTVEFITMPLLSISEELDINSLEKTENETNDQKEEVAG